MVYGEERWDPYNRVQLSSLMAAQVRPERLTRDQIMSASVVCRIGRKIAAIDPQARCVVEADGRGQPYSRLILATGSKPYVPNIPGIDTPGVYTFRNQSDAEKLRARQVRSRRTVVLGGGLLGLETARAMRRFHTEVWIVEFADRLMPRQLDHDLAGCLQARVEAAGIKVLLGNAVDRIIGDEVVEGVLLKSQRIISCDTVVIAAGIVPRIDMARAAGLKMQRGVLVNETMQTSDPCIYAIGECAQHPERRAGRASGVRIYGAAAPSLEQARIAAHAIAADPIPYSAGPVAMRLKVLNVPVFSMGRIDASALRGAKAWHYRDAKTDTDRKLVMCQGRLVGALSVGEWDHLGRIQGAITEGRKIWAWQLLRFRRTGSPWPERAPAIVADWPASVTVCNCMNVTRGQLSTAIARGHCTVRQLAAVTGASTVCGTCRPLLAELIGGDARPEPVPAHRSLLMTAVAALVLVLLLSLTPGVPYARTLDAVWQWDSLWRNGTFKQISGFSIVGLTTLGVALVVTKKRIVPARGGSVDIWRWSHVVLSFTAMLALAIHTGGRLGSGLNFWLLACILSLILAGVAQTGVIAVAHQLRAGTARRIRWGSAWLHVLLFWPIPILLLFHVIKSYYF